MLFTVLRFLPVIALAVAVAEHPVRKRPVAIAVAPVREHPVRTPDLAIRNVPLSPCKTSLRVKKS